jgi:hypothetical protein
MNLNPKFQLPLSKDEILKPLNELDELEKLEPWRKHDYQFFAFSLIAIRTYYKDHDEHSHDLLRVISEDYELFLSEVYKDEDSMESFERQANNYFVTLID